jgi:flagellar biosynthesis chaperone FliJ
MRQGGPLSNRRAAPFYVYTLLKRFTFNLDSVKRLRADEEQRAQAELGRSLATHAAAEAARLERRRSLMAAQAQLQAGVALAAQLIQSDRDRDAAAMRLGAADVAVRQADAAVGVSRLELNAASQRLEALERLEARRRTAHRVAALRDEELSVQEIVEARSARRIRSGASQ